MVRFLALGVNLNFREVNVDLIYFINEEIHFCRRKLLRFKGKCGGKAAKM